MTRVKRIDDFLIESVEYAASDFTPCGNITEECIEYILDNIEGFDEMYSAAMRKIDFYRCSLSYADDDLYNKICELAMEYLSDTLGESVVERKEDEIRDDIDEVFG